jgi:ArsR family transcriptional regulator
MTRSLVVVLSEHGKCTQLCPFWMQRVPKNLVSDRFFRWVDGQLDMSDDLLSKSKELAKCFKALGDIARLRIVARLAANTELNVSELVEALEVSQPLISWHLRRLEKVGLVEVRRRGRQAYYSLNWGRLRRCLQEFAEVLGKAGQQMGNG